ncbi:MAG: aldehyde dehydrogenase family protein [Myxococcales bacterium]|nr:aldehyde dehydrogenase family protein [Myxococcales bacterium]|tara:strand:- start:932 stop:2452 length:1521 start_codon:yes stop_codon:yes gene_type:complete
MSVLDLLGLHGDNAGTCLGPNQWSEDGARWITSYNPSTGESLGRVRATTSAEYERLVEHAQAVAKRWADVPAPQRGEAVRLLGQALREHKSELGQLISLEMGKILVEGEGEVQEAIDIADFALGQSRMLYGRSMHSERPEHRMYEQWHPLGVIGVITAFNFPMAVWAWNACISAICGNVTIWKPSPKAPLCALALQMICNRVLDENGYPPIFMLFNDDEHTVSKQFVDDPRIRLVSFTGSTQVGREVASVVGRRLGKCLLELGGNNALILDRSADLKLALPAIVFGAVGTAGQRCTTTRRLFVDRACADGVIETLKSAYSQVRVGDPLAAQTLMGPLIDNAACVRFEETVARAKAAGGVVLHGGQRLDRDGYFVEPTIIMAEAHWPIVKEETFAPILYVIIHDDLDTAIHENNAVSQGLSSALFTTDVRQSETFLSSRGSDCGIANINIGTSGAEIGGAFGGEKDTGGGRESGSDAWKAYMRRQTNTINWGRQLPLAQGIKFDLEF